MKIFYLSYKDIYVLVVLFLFKNMSGYRSVGWFFKFIFYYILIVYIFFYRYQGLNREFNYARSRKWCFQVIQFIPYESAPLLFSQVSPLLLTNQRHLKHGTPINLLKMKSGKEIKVLIQSVIIRVLQAGKWNFERGQKRSKMTFLGLKMIIFCHFSRFLASFKISFSSLHPTHNLSVLCESFVEPNYRLS